MFVDDLIKAYVPNNILPQRFLLNSLQVQTLLLLSKCFRKESVKNRLLGLEI